MNTFRPARVPPRMRQMLPRQRRRIAIVEIERRFSMMALSLVHARRERPTALEMRVAKTARSR